MSSQKVFVTDFFVAQVTVILRCRWVLPFRSRWFRHHWLVQTIDGWMTAEGILHFERRKIRRKLGKHKWQILESWWHHTEEIRLWRWSWRGWRWGLDDWMVSKLVLKKQRRRRKILTAFVASELFCSCFRGFSSKIKRINNFVLNWNSMPTLPIAEWYLTNQVGTRLYCFEILEMQQVWLQYCLAFHRQIPWVWVLLQVA